MSIMQVLDKAGVLLCKKKNPAKLISSFRSVMLMITFCFLEYKRLCCHGNTFTGLTWIELVLLLFYVTVDLIQYFSIFV